MSRSNKTRSTASLQRRSKFLTLPLEIRTLIYQELFSNATIKPRIRDEDRIPDLRPWRSILSPTLYILLVCRQIYTEASPLWMKHCTFCFCHFERTHWSCLKPWIDFDDKFAPLPDPTYMDADVLYQIQQVCLGSEFMYGMLLEPTLDDRHEERLGRTVRAMFAEIDFTKLRIEGISIEMNTTEAWVADHDMQWQPDFLCWAGYQSLRVPAVFRHLQACGSIPFPISIDITHNGYQLEPYRAGRYQKVTEDVVSFRLERDGRVRDVVSKGSCFEERVFVSLGIWDQSPEGDRVVEGADVVA